MDTDGQLSDTIVLLTGGTGSLGGMLTALLHQRFRPRKIIIFSRDEQKQQRMAEELAFLESLRFFIGDVRDYDRLRQVMEGVDYCFHLAAMKHIDVCEYNPLETIKTNVLGSANVVRACLEHRVRRAILVSTDKAVSPINLYGATKLAAEKLFLAANAYNRTLFKLVRYGNVLASRGSVIETFLNLKAQGLHELPITDERMTRFWISLPQAAETVVATLLAEPNLKIGIPQIPSMKVVDVARAIDPDCTFRITGMRPGEKLHECLVSPEERVPGFEQGYYSHTNRLWLSPDKLREMIGL